MSQKTHNCLYLAGAAAVWLYLILRAGYVPPVHDEAATFFHYVNHREYWPGKALWDANNHILNSFFSWYFVKLFGVNTLALRMANLLFFPVYAWFLYKLSRELQSGWTRFLLLLSGLTVHGLVEYFGYARGYGMSMALLLGALYYGYRFFSEKNIRVLLPSLALFWLATAGNLTLQNSVLLFIGLAAVYLLVEKFDGKTRLYGFLYLAAGIAALFPLIRLSFRMKEDGLLYYAAGEDFWTAVITSYTKQYFDSNLFAVKLFWFTWTGILLSGVFALLLRRGKWNTERKAAFFFPLLFLGNLTGIFAMHFLLDVNYPSDRTGMQLVLFLLLACLFVADAGKPWQRALVTLPSLIFVVQFLAGANLSYSTYWKGEHLPERFWTRIHDESESGRYLKNPTLGGYRIRNLVWAWHNFRNGGSLQNMQYPEYCTGMEDYQVFSPGDYAAWTVTGTIRWIPTNIQTWCWPAAKRSFPRNCISTARAFPHPKAVRTNSKTCLKPMPRSPSSTIPGWWKRILSSIRWLHHPKFMWSPPCPMRTERPWITRLRPCIGSKKNSARKIPP